MRLNISTNHPARRLGLALLTLLVVLLLLSSSAQAGRGSQPVARPATALLSTLPGAPSALPSLP